MVGETWQTKVTYVPSAEQMKRAFRTKVPIPFMISGMGRIEVKVSQLELTCKVDVAASIVGTGERPIGFWWWKKVQSLRLAIECYPNRHAEMGTATVTVVSERKPRTASSP